jgi:uroporphyrinogen-III decarboxylase
MGHAEYAAGGSDYDSCVSCPFKTVEQVLSFEPIKQYGITPKKELIQFFNKKYDEKCKANPNGINTIGTYTTFISGAIDIFGWDMFLMALGTDMDRCGQTMTRYSDYMMQYYEALAESKSPYILIHDDMVWTSGPFVHPDWYRKYVFPAFKRYIKPILNSGKKVLFCSDGDFSAFIDDIADCGFQGFIFEPMTDMEYIVRKYGKTHVIIGNADTRILLSGTKEEIYKETKRCMDLGRDCPGFFMAVGNHIPANTPVENAIYYNECYEKMSIRW